MYVCHDWDSFLLADKWSLRLWPPNEMKLWGEFMAWHQPLWLHHYGDWCSKCACAGFCAHASVCVWPLLSFHLFYETLRGSQRGREDWGHVSRSLSLLSSVITLKQSNSITFFIISIYRRCQSCHARFTLLQRAGCNARHAFIISFPAFLSR